MQVLVVRTRQIMGGLSYELLVPVSDIPGYDASNAINVLHPVEGNAKRETFWRFDDAVLPEKFYAMPCGFEKYELGQRLREKARDLALDVLHDCYPETARLNEYPRLWETGLLPKEQETDAQVWAMVDLDMIHQALDYHFYN